MPDPLPYKRLIDKLLYLTLTRPDITYPIHILSQFMKQPTVAHTQAAKRVLRYLLTSPGKGILLASQQGAILTAYCDSD